MVFLLLLNRIVFNKEIFKIVADKWDVSSDQGITFIQKLKKKDLDGPGTFLGLIEFDNIPQSPFFQFEFKTNQEPQIEGQLMHLGFILDNYQMFIYQHSNKSYLEQSSQTTFDIHIQKWLFFAFTFEKNSNQVELVLRSSISKFEQISIVLQQPMNISSPNLLFTFFSKDLNRKNQVLLKSFQFIPKKLQNLQDSIFLLSNEFQQEVFLFQNKRGKNKMIKYSDIKNPANLQIINDNGVGPVKSLYRSDKIFNFKQDNIKNFYFSIKLQYQRSFISKIKIFRFENLKNEFLEIFIFEKQLQSYIGIQYQNQIQILENYRLLFNEMNQIDIIIQKVYDEQLMILQLQQNDILKQKVFQTSEIPFEFQNFTVQYFQHLQLEQYRMLKEIRIETNYNFNYMLITKFMPKKNLQGCKIYQINDGNFICGQCQHDFKMQNGKCQLQCSKNFNTVNSFCIPCVGSNCDSNLKFSFSVNKMDENSFIITYNQYKFGLQKNFNDLFQVDFENQPLQYTTNQIDINKYIIRFQQKRIRNQNIEIKIKNQTLSNIYLTQEYHKVIFIQKNNPDQIIMSISFYLMTFSSIFLILFLLLKPVLDLKLDLGYNSFFCIKLFQSYLILQLFQFIFYVKNNQIIQRELLQEFNRIMFMKFSFQLSNNFQKIDFFKNAYINSYMMNFLIIYGAIVLFYVVIKIIYFLLKRQKKKVKQIYSTEVLKKLLLFKKKIKYIINNFEMKIIYWINLLFSPSLIFFSLRTLKYTDYISQQLIAITIITVQLLFVFSTYFITIKSKMVLFNTKFNKRYGFLYEGCQILQNYKPLFFSIQLALIITAVQSQYIFKHHEYLYFVTNFCLFLIALSQVIRYKPIFENFWQKEQQCFLMLITAYFGLQILANINKKIYLRFLDIASVILINIILLWNVIFLSYYLINKIKNSSKQKQSDEKGSVIVPADANNSKYKDSQDKKNMFYQSLRKNRRSIKQIKKDKHPRSEQGDQEGIYFKEFVLDLSDQEIQSPGIQNSPIKKIGDLVEQKNLKDLYKSDSNSDKTLQNFVNNKQRCLIQFPSSDFDNSSDSNYYSQNNYQPEMKKSKFYKN